jgi:signal transduction histidine kinase
LPQLAQAHANAAKQAASLKQSSGEITLDALDDGGSINFDNL